MNTIHCAECGSLIEKTLSIDGYGIRCGCLKRKYKLLKKQVSIVTDSNKVMGEITVNVTRLDEYKEVLKYAEEAGAACEEMKHGIEEVLRESDILLNPDEFKSDFTKGYDAGMRKVVKRIEKHLSKYLDE